MYYIIASTFIVLKVIKKHSLLVVVRTSLMYIYTVTSFTHTLVACLKINECTHAVCRPASDIHVNDTQHLSTSTTTAITTTLTALALTRL